jgi:hypothetical protein
MIDFSFINFITYSIITRLMPISIWQKNRLADSNNVYYFVRKMNSNNDRLAEVGLSGEE